MRADSFVEGRMKSITQIDRWLHGTIRAWVEGGQSACGQSELLRVEATTLIWVSDEHITWAGAHEIFEEMASDLRAELGMEGGEE